MSTDLSLNTKERVDSYIGNQFNSSYPDINQHVLLYFNGTEGVPSQHNDDMESNDADIAMPDESKTEYKMPELSITSVYAMYYYITERPNRRRFCMEMKTKYNTSTKNSIKVYNHFVIQQLNDEGTAESIGSYQWISSSSKHDAFSDNASDINNNNNNTRLDIYDSNAIRRKGSYKDDEHTMARSTGFDDIIDEYKALCIPFRRIRNVYNSKKCMKLWRDNVTPRVCHEYVDKQSKNIKNMNMNDGLSDLKHILCDIIYFNPNNTSRNDGYQSFGIMHSVQYELDQTNWYNLGLLSPSQLTPIIVYYRYENHKIFQTILTKIYLDQQRMNSIKLITKSGPYSIFKLSFKRSKHLITIYIPKQYEKALKTYFFQQKLDEQYIMAIREEIIIIIFNGCV